MWRLILVLLVALGGFWFGKTLDQEPQTLSKCHSEKEFPISEHKSFVVFIYAYNQALWCERSLRSVFEQEYDHYRVIVVDDGSTDGTAGKATQFIVDNNQEEKVIFIRNESRIGEVASLYKAIDNCLDREILIPIAAKDWLSSPFILSRLNHSYQNPDVWISLGQTLEYPSYEIGQSEQISFYAALFKQIRLEDLFDQGKFALHPDVYLKPLADMAHGRIKKIEQPIAFHNEACPTHPLEKGPVAEYSPLDAFPKARAEASSDLLIFSTNQPLQLYACLESVQRYMTGYENLTVLYRADLPEFAEGYELVKRAFPTVHFIFQSKKDSFKQQVEKIAFETPSEYILFGLDDIILKDFVDLKLCTDQLEKTKAYGFYLCFGRHIADCDLSNQPLLGGVYAWELKRGEGSWEGGYPLNMTLFKKETIEKTVHDLKYKNPNDLEFAWEKSQGREKGIGLYFEHSKLVNATTELSQDDLLAKLNLGLKVDIEPLYKIENGSPHFPYAPEFVLR